MSHAVEDENPFEKRDACTMNTPIAVILLVVGIVLIALGVSAMNSFSSDVSQFFTGAPTDKAVWMLIGGGVASAVGLVMILRKGKSI